MRTSSCKTETVR